MNKKADWWHDFFPAFRPVFNLRRHKITNAEVRFLIKRLKLTTGSEFLDCPCGIGRIALPLARKGIRVTGVDIAPYYLDELASKARRRGLSVELHEGDMRDTDFHNRFDAAANLWTSFGYFEKESDNQKVLKRMYQAIKPGGRFLLRSAGSRKRLGQRCSCDKRLNGSDWSLKIRSAITRKSQRQPRGQPLKVKPCKTFIWG